MANEFINASFATNLLRDILPVFDCHLERKHKQTQPGRPLYRFAPACRSYIQRILLSKEHNTVTSEVGASDSLSKLLRLLDTCVRSTVCNAENACFDGNLSFRKLRFLQWRVRNCDSKIKQTDHNTSARASTLSDLIPGLSKYIQIPSKLDISHDGLVIRAFMDYLDELQSSPNSQTKLDAPMLVSPKPQTRPLASKYRLFADTLYDCLISHVGSAAKCGNTVQESKSLHAINLCLSSAKFHNYTGNDVEVELAITNHDKEWKSCRFSPQSRCINENLSVKLCEVLDETLPDHDTLCFFTDGNNLWHDTSTPNKNMGYITSNPCFFHKYLDQGAWLLLLEAKRKLMVIIARAITQLYGSKWVRNEWKRHSILFFPSKDLEMPNFVLPFLSISDPTSVEYEASSDPSSSKLSDMLNGGNPLLRQLGILLLEIEIGTSIGDVQNESRFIENDPTANDLVKAHHIYQDLANKLYGPLRSVIELCLYSRTSLLASNIPHPDSPEEFCKFLDMYIVNPLELEFGNAIYPRSLSPDEPDFWRCDRRHLEPRKPKAVSYVKPSIISPLQETGTTIQKSLLNKSKFWDYKLDQKDETSYVDVDDWFNFYNERVLGKLKGKAVKPRLKIAIIDSYIDCNRPNLLSIGDRLKEVRKFYKESAENQDTTKPRHGSHVVALLHRMAPFADIYVAEVAGADDEFNDNALTEAIECAVEREDGWKADMIVMSFGWYSGESKSEFPKFEEALNKNSEPYLPRLFFAAASNGGGNRPCTYPATRSSVFAIYATDHYGDKPSPNFNPTGESNRMNYSTIGHQVPGDSDDTRVSGTSFATPVAAGIAATVIELFRRQKVTDRKMFQYLQTYDGMRKVLDDMAVERDHGYHYLNWAKSFEKSAEEIANNILTVLRR